MVNQTIGFVTMTDHQMKTERVNREAWMTAATLSTRIAEAAERSPRIGRSSVLARIRSLLNARTLAPVR